MSAPDYVEPIVGMRSWRLRDRILRPINVGERFSRFQDRPMTDHFRETMLQLEQWTPGVALGAVCAGQEVFERQELVPVSVWPEGTLYEPRPVRRVVDCRNTQHLGIESPAEGCSCGHYATRLAGRLPIPPFSCYLRPSELIVIGQVVLWGRLIEHQEGWRAQYAYPGRVYVMRHFKSLERLISFEDDEYRGGGGIDLDSAAHELSHTYGIRAQAIHPWEMVRGLPWDALMRRGLLDDYATLRDTSAPNVDEQVVRPWAYPSKQPICVRCGRGLDLSDSMDYQHYCGGRYDELMRYQFAPTYDPVIKSWH